MKDYMKRLRHWLHRILHHRHKHHHHRHPMWVKITFGETNMASVTLNVGQSVIATVTVLDQYGNPFPYDLNANVPSWTISDPANIGLESGATVDTEKVVANGASTATLTVNVAGVPNPIATASVTAVMAPAVASTVEISFGTAS